MTILPLPPESAFSRSVFKLIRPHIPRERWPLESVRGIFTGAGDGLWLDADLNGLPPAHAALAVRLIRQAGVELVLQSPAAGFAAAVVRAKRWRDAALYAFLPSLFAIPFMGSLSDTALQVAVLVCCVDVVALLAFQVALMRRRAAMVAARFIAHIPSPGLKISINGGKSPPLGLDSIPEV